MSLAFFNLFTDSQDFPSLLLHSEGTSWQLALGIGHEMAACASGASRQVNFHSRLTDGPGRSGPLEKDKVSKSSMWDGFFCLGKRCRFALFTEIHVDSLRL